MYLTSNRNILQMVLSRLNMINNYNLIRMFIIFISKTSHLALDNHHVDSDCLALCPCIYLYNDPSAFGLGHYFFPYNGSVQDSLNPLCESLYLSSHHVYSRKLALYIVGFSTIKKTTFSIFKYNKTSVIVLYVTVLFIMNYSIKG